MKSTPIHTERQRELVSALSRVPHLVLSTKHRETCAINVHGRVLLYPKAWDDGFVEDMLAFVPMQASDKSSPALAKTATDEPLVHLHVDWTQIKQVYVQTKPPNRIHCDARVVLAPSPTLADSAISFYALQADLEPLSAYGLDRWTAL